MNRLQRPAPQGVRFYHAPMPKTVNATTHLVDARRLLKTARTVDELRQAQAVLLPLELGLSIAETARAIGRSVGMTSTLRNAFGKADKVARPSRAARPSGPPMAATERERALLVDVLREVSAAGVPNIAAIKSGMEVKLGSTLALSTVYRTLARHGWRKNGPFPDDLLEQLQQVHSNVPSPSPHDLEWLS